MRNKLRNRLFLLILLLITWLDLGNFGTIPVSKISPAVPIFPQLQIDLLRAKEQSLVNDAVRKTTKMLLQYIVPEYCEEPWETNFLFLDLLGDREPEVIFSFALPPERGILVLLQKEGKNYFLVAYRNDLLPISKLQKLPLPSNLPIFVTREDHQERLGAYCETSVITLWKWQNNRLQEIFTENSFWEINWLNTWQNAESTPPKWLKLRQALKITCQEKEQQLFLLVEGEQESSEAPTLQTAEPQSKTFHSMAPPTPDSQAVSLPAEYAFNTLQTRRISRIYYWDEQWQHFILRTGTYLPPNKKIPQKIAVLKDLNDHLETLLSPTPNPNTADPPISDPAKTVPSGYLVIDEKGQIFTLPRWEVGV